MKIRLTENMNLSIDGFLLEANKIIDLPKNMEVKIEKFIKSGIIVVVDPEDSEKINAVVKVDAAPEQKSNIEKRVNLLTTEEIYIEKDNNLNIIKEEGIEDTPITPLIPKEQNQEVISEESSQETLVIDHSEDNLEDGFVVLSKKTPGEGVAISTAKYIEGQVNSVKDVIEGAAKELASLKEEEPKPIINVPERTQEVLDKEANKRKAFIAQLSDKEFLLEIAQNTHDKNIQSIINQRLEELK